MTSLGHTAARPQLIRALNEQLLLDQLRRQGPASRSDLVRASGLSKPTVALALANLERAALVEAAGRRTGAPGRTAALFQIRSDAGYVLGLDVGREYVRGAVADVAGTLRAHESRRARSTSGSGRVRELVALGEHLLERAHRGRRKPELQTVVGSPGVVDSSGRNLKMAANLPGWERPAVLAGLRRAFGESVMIENDVDAAALAERDHGHGRNVRTFAFVSIGTGIGMGLVIDGALHRGAHGAAGEIAYLPISPDGVDPNDARRRGPLEASASSAAVVRAARAAGLRRARSAREVFEDDDERARKVVSDEADLVARAVASIIAVVDPELIVLGGGIGRAPGFADQVAARLSKLAPVVPNVRASALGDEAIVSGCIAVGTEHLWDRVLRSRDN